MYVHVTDMSVYVPTLNTIFTAPSLQIIVGWQVYASLLYSKTFALWNFLQAHNYQPNMVYTRIYKYMICTYMVCTCMYSVHKHSSFPIRPNQPCYAGKSLLCSQSVPVEQHPGATSRQGVGIYMYIPCIYHVQTAHIHFQAVLSYAMIQTCIYMAYTFTADSSYTFLSIPVAC